MCLVGSNEVKSISNAKVKRRVMNLYTYNKRLAVQLYRKQALRHVISNRLQGDSFVQSLEKIVWASSFVFFGRVTEIFLINKGQHICCSSHISKSLPSFHSSRRTIIPEKKVIHLRGCSSIITLKNFILKETLIISLERAGYSKITIIS